MPEWKPTRLEVPLPVSGYKVTLRPLRSYDRIVILGNLPNPTMYGTNPGDEPEKEIKSLSQVNGRLMEDTIKLAVASIVTHPLGKLIVAKQPQDLTDGKEISFFDLPEQDQGALLKAYGEMQEQDRGTEAPGTMPEAFREGGGGAAAPAGAAPDGNGLGGAS